MRLRRLIDYRGDHQTKVKDGKHSRNLQDYPLIAGIELVNTYPDRGGG